MGFKVGQKVVFPNRGIGIIESIERYHIGQVPMGVSTPFLLDRESADRGIEFLLQQMEPESAALLRLGAIPHYISADILQVLEPKLDSSDAREACAEFSKFSFITINEDGLVMHEDVRDYLFLQWITPLIATEFIEANTRLVKYFESFTQDVPDAELQTLQLQRLFHMFGANMNEAFGEFERLLVEAASDNRLSDCECLIKLVHRYQDAGVLKREYVTRLTIYEGDLAATHGRWEAAEKLFKQKRILRLLNSNREQIISDYLGMITAKEHRGDLSRVIILLNDSYQPHGEGEEPFLTQRLKPSSEECLPFYSLRLAATNSVVLVPVANAGEVGLRSPISSGECEILFKALGDDFTSAPCDWKDRFKEFTDRMRTGDIFEVAAVLKHLTYLSHQKPLSFREQRMLERARYLVVSELAAASRKPESSVTVMVDQALARAYAKHNGIHTRDADLRRKRTKDINLQQKQP